jgi:hypothetical protein
MVKKRIIDPIKETATPKKTITPIKIPKKTAPKKKVMTKVELEEALLNNFINLQKVLTNLSIKFEDLSDNVSKLLQLFEISAKSFTERYSETDRKQETKEDKHLLNKLDSLLDQNKTIAKGIMLMEGRIRQRKAPTQTKREERFEEMLKSKPLQGY